MNLISVYVHNLCAIPQKNRRFQTFRRFTVLAVVWVQLGLLTVQAVLGQNAEDHASVGISLARQGKLAEAEHELRQAVQAAPAVAVYRAQLGSILGTCRLSFLLDTAFSEMLKNSPI
jgi:hypothetical protein